MSDKEKKDKKPDKPKGDGKKDGGEAKPAGLAVTAFLAVIGGGLLIGACFLPLISLKPDVAEKFLADKAELDKVLAENKKRLDEAREKKETFNRTDIKMVDRFFVPEEKDKDMRLTPEDVDTLKVVLDAFEKFVQKATLLNLYGAAQQIQQGSKVLRYTVFRNIKIGDFIDKMMYIKMAVMALPICGGAAILFALIHRLRKLNAIFLIVLFTCGSSLLVVSGLLELFTTLWKYSDKLNLGNTIHIAEEYKIVPYEMGLGTHLILIGSICLTITSLFGVSRKNAGICFGGYLLVLGAVGWMAWVLASNILPKAVESQDAAVPAAPSARVASLLPGAPHAEPISGH